MVPFPLDVDWSGKWQYLGVIVQKDQLVGKILETVGNKPGDEGALSFATLSWEKNASLVPVNSRGLWLIPSRLGTKIMANPHFS